MTKSSSSRKHRSGKKHSKLSLMRKKLTPRSQISPVHFETDIKKVEIDHAENTTDGEQSEEVRKEEEEEEEELNEDNREEEQAIFLSQAKSKETSTTGITNEVGQAISKHIS